MISVALVATASERLGEGRAGAALDLLVQRMTPRRRHRIWRRA
jgi:hypothetical protein